MVLWRPIRPSRTNTQKRCPFHYGGLECKRSQEIPGVTGKLGLGVQNEAALIVNKGVWNAVLGCNLKNDRIISVHFQGKPFNITVIQVCAPTSNAKEAEVEWFYEDVQDLLELTPRKEILFIIGDWNAKVRGQETPGVTGKFGLGVQNEAEQKLIEFCQENALVIANILFQQHKTLHMDITRWSTAKSDYILCILDILLYQFGSSLFFQIQFKLLIFDLHTGFTEG